MIPIFNYRICLRILFVFVFFCGVLSACGLSSRYTLENSDSKPNAIISLAKPFSQDTATTKNTEYTSINQFNISNNRDVKTSIAHLLFIEHPIESNFKKYNFCLNNKLIYYGRKAIFFPFQYFW